MKEGLSYDLWPRKSTGKWVQLLEITAIYGFYYYQFIWWLDLLLLRRRVINSYLGILKWHRELWNAEMKPLIVSWGFYVSWRKRTNLAFIISFVVLATGLRWFGFNPVQWSKDIAKKELFMSIVLKTLHHWSCRHEFTTGFWVLKCSDLITAMTSKWSTLSHHNTQPGPLVCCSNITYWF